MITLRPGRMHEASALTALAVRSKAWWGYDAAFMRACHDELTVRHDTLADRRLIVAEVDGEPAGLIAFGRPEAPPEVLLFFVDPPHMGQGVGRALWQAGLDLARARGWASFEVASDPGAEPFYRRMGCVPIGEIASDSIPGRSLPLLRFTLEPPPAAPTIGPARPDELPLLGELEMRAGERFRAVGRADVADGPPLPRYLLESIAAKGGVSVARDDRPLGFVVFEPLDGALHIEEISVLPEAGGRGLGTRLLEHVACRARLGGQRAVTLCTFADVPWNAPYYARRGFEVVAPEQQSPGLRQRASADAARGLDPDSRVVMRRPSGL